MVQDHFFYYVCRNCKKKFLGYCPEECEKCGKEDFAVIFGDWAYSGNNKVGGSPPKMMDIGD